MSHELFPVFLPFFTVQNIFKISLFEVTSQTFTIHIMHNNMIILKLLFMQNNIQCYIIMLA